MVDEMKKAFASQEIRTAWIGLGAEPPNLYGRGVRRIRGQPRPSAGARSSRPPTSRSTDGTIARTRRSADLAIADASRWERRARSRQARLARAEASVGADARGKVVPAESCGGASQCGNRARRPSLPGREQPEAGGLPRHRPGRSSTRPRMHDLHMVQSVLALPEHLDLFENGIATKLDFSFSGPQGARLARMVGSGKMRSVRSTPTSSCSPATSSTSRQTSRWCARRRLIGDGNLYTGPNTEDTPAIVEATAFRGGIVIAQVNEMRRYASRASTSRATGSIS